jgi:Skp family chaperone for outer membrane proteins
MHYETYYQHLHLHHRFITNIHSFAITNVSDLNVELTIPDQGNQAPRKMTFEEALLTSVKPGTNTKLFYSIEPTKFTDTEGCYLLLTNKELIEDAQAYVDNVFRYMSQHTPDAMTRITRNKSPVTRVNRTTTSDRFQSYATALQMMIPTSINTNTMIQNAWKRRPPTIMDLNVDNFPQLEATKKQRTDETTATDMDMTSEAVETLTMVDLDEIQNAQKEMQAALQQQINALRKENEDMRKQMSDEFSIKMGQLELRIEQNTKKMLKAFGDEWKCAVKEMTTQADRTDQMIKEFKEDVSREMSQQINLVIQAIQSNQSADGMTHFEPLECPETKKKDTPDPQQEDFHMHKAQADGSLNPFASWAHPNYGMGPSTSGHK